MTFVCAESAAKPRKILCASNLHLPFGVGRRVRIPSDPQQLNSPRCSTAAPEVQDSSLGGGEFGRRPMRFLGLPSAEPRKKKATRKSRLLFLPVTAVAI